MTKLNVVLFAAIAIAAVAQPAAAIEYPSCAQYGGGDDNGGRNCGFVSYEQWMETIRGMGGSCEPNLFYSGSASDTSQPKRKGQD